ncbi:hypothetical protein ACFQ60_05555 [Streptomyces zhihengii]
MSTGTRPGGAASPTGRDGTDTGADLETGTGNGTDPGAGTGTGNDTDTDTGTADMLRFLAAVRGAHRAAGGGAPRSPPICCCSSAACGACRCCWRAPASRAPERATTRRTVRSSSSCRCGPPP